MGSLTDLLNQRTKKTDNSSKMAAMAQASATGHLTSFAGMFSVSELSQKEKETLEQILKEYAQGGEDVQNDLSLLISITSEVKAIQNQAAILHGERIKKAHSLLIPYRDGAFTAWLKAAYGNRQTPYNLMQYYEFYESMPKPLKPQVESMPRQAVYVLASRNGDPAKKKSIVENYRGETKNEMLQIIRGAFPLEEKDKRRIDIGNGLIQQLNKLCQAVRGQEVVLSNQQKKAIRSLMEEFNRLVF